MGNSHGVPWARGMNSNEADAMFHALDIEGKSYLTLKDLLAPTPPGLVMPHSLPALYFSDENKEGTLSRDEFVSLVHSCETEKRNVQDALTHDKDFRDLIHRASKAGVKDCSVHGRTSYRRMSSYSNVRSVYISGGDSSARPGVVATGPVSCASRENDFSSLTQGAKECSTKPDIAVDAAACTSPPPLSSGTTHDCGDSSLSSEGEEVKHDGLGRISSVAMYSSQREFDKETEPSSTDPDLNTPQNCTALDAAVMEKVMHENIRKLADLLHTEGSRENFMAWLWKLADFNHSSVVTLEELRVFLSAVGEDGIDLEELAFYREGGVPLEECIINEFDTTHSGMLSRDEFMVLADLVTREYEFWENRHLDRVGDYELGRTIGRGSSGVVRHAMHVETRQKVAIKIIKKGKCSDLSRLDREIQSLMAAKHKNIVELHEVLDSETNIFIVMELCGGGSMVDIVRLYPEERMPEDTARFFMRQVFEALAFCHRNGICHRDVRLDNLMLDNSGTVKITDFGHSGIYTPGWDFFQTSLVGSVYNLSPEQIMGQLYSGEKIDIWSAGVAVYCLLVGRPPFFEPEVCHLLDRITRCDFETPDFLSPNAQDFIRCMIRAVPSERISMQQMLHHPWFYDGPEAGPSMNVVVIPVDAFFIKRPDIAEMIMAITIYQHSLHFHLADTKNPRSSPDDQRGQAWSLKCLCPKNDIKFSVSLFTKKPSSVQKAKSGQLGSSTSWVALTEAGAANGTEAGSADSSGGLDELTRGLSDFIRRDISIAMEGGVPKVTEGERRESSPGLSSHEIGCGEKDGGVSTSRPPLQKRVMRVTPMGVAAHIRESCGNGGSGRKGATDVFDFDLDRSCEKFDRESFREEVLSGKKHRWDDVDRKGKNRRKGRHSRRHSLDNTESMRRMNRSATVDAFPYQKVYPQREMPESARLLNFDRPRTDAGWSEDAESDGYGGDEESSEGRSEGCDSNNSNLRCSQRNATTHGVCSVEESVGGRGQGGVCTREGEIAQEIWRHPSKAISPQSPQVRLGSGPDEMNEKVESLSLKSDPEDGGDRDVVVERTEEPGGWGDGEEVMDGFQAFMEVRLQGGESGLFLKVCRKLKTICTTKLAAAAERQKKRSTGGRSLTALRRSASARSMGSVVTSDGLLGGGLRG